MPSEPVLLGGANLKGNLTAKAAIVEFSEFQCPFCAAFARDSFPTIDREYVQSGRLLFAFRHYPIKGIHPVAETASEAAECAATKNRFWEMHDLLFADQKQLAVQSLVERARTIGLNTHDFIACLNGTQRDKIADDIAQGEKYQVQATPTFFVGILLPDSRVRVLKVIRGAQPVTEFSSAIEAVLKVAESSLAK